MRFVLTVPLAIGVVACSALLACRQAESKAMRVDAAPPAQAQLGTILFVRLNGSNFHTNAGAELYRMKSDGSAPERLTHNEAHDAYPAWSPDGQRIAFVSDRDNPQLRGRRMTLASGKLGPQMALEVYIMSADGSGLTRLTSDTAGSFVSPQAWSPDGQRLLIDSHSDGDSEILLTGPDGTIIRRLTDNEAWDGSANWSPDGKRIVFRSDRDGESALYLMRPDGSNVVRLTRSGDRAAQPVWSPDGNRIAFTFMRHGNPEIGTVKADGTEPQRLTDHPAEDRWPAWSPDGRRIAFVSTRDGNAEIYVMNADGSQPQRLTSDPNGDESPTWLPTDLAHSP